MSHPLTTTARRGAAALAALAALTGLALTALPDAEAATVPTHDRALQRSLDDLVRNKDVPAALASVRDRHGRVTNYTAGVADVRTRAKVPTDGYVRIASNTKMYTAVVVLQLVGEGKIKLDGSVETYLPGVVRGKGIDAKKITVRQLLQHTGGVPANSLLKNGILPIRDRYFDARESLDSDLALGATFPPGTDWQYSNGGYTVLGLIAQRVAGRPFAELVTTRIIDRLGLKETYYPAPGDRTVRKPHPKGYLPTEDGKLLDITEFDPSVAGAAGQMIATPSDVNKFLAGLQDGKLLQPRELAEMRKTVPAKLLPGWEYGLGVIKFPLSCGGTAYGHGGDADGYESRAAITTDGRAVTVVITNDTTAGDTTLKVIEVFDAALCAK